MEDSTFRANLAQAGNGGIGAFAAIGGGGAIVNDNSLTVDGTSFVDNQAVGGSNSLSPTHNGHALGGGIMSGTLLALLGAGSATLTVSDSTFSHNLAQGGNDNQVTDAFVPRSDAPDNAYGGGILVYQGSAAISSTTVTKNQAIGGTGYGINGEGSLGVGGGIFFYNFVGGVTASVDGSTISDNNAIGGDGEAGVEGGEGLGGGIAIGGLGSPYTGAGFGHDQQHHRDQEPRPGRQGRRRGRRGRRTGRRSVQRHQFHGDAVLHHDHQEQSQGRPRARRPGPGRQQLRRDSVIAGFLRPRKQPESTVIATLVLCWFSRGGVDLRSSDNGGQKNGRGTTDSGSG